MISVAEVSADVHASYLVRELKCCTLFGMGGERMKAAGVDIRWEEELAFDLPYPSASFDRVISCLMIHHLTTPNKLKAFQEVFRILKPGGEFHLLDFGKPSCPGMRLISIPIARMEEAGDNIRGLLSGMLREAGLSEITETRHFKTVFGELVHYQSRRFG